MVNGYESVSTLSWPSSSVTIPEKFPMSRSDPSDVKLYGSHHVGVATHEVDIVQVPPLWNLHKKGYRHV